jgi:hypothetical protein
MLSVDPPGGSTEKVTESSGSLARTFVASANAFLNGSAGLWLSCIKVTHRAFGGIHFVKTTERFKFII